MGFKPVRHKGPDKPSLIIANHNTDLDPAFIGLAFSRHMYFIASEHALRAGFPSKILKFLFDPVPINKSRTDVSSVKEMIRRLKAGASVCLFAEGDRSFNGSTAPLNLSTAKLVKSSGADLITYRFEGAYFVTPRWAKRMRKGLIKGSVTGTYPAEEVKSMSDYELLRLIERDIYEDAYERQVDEPCSYTGRDLAENIETVLYICSNCCAVGSIKSEGNRFFCKCGLNGIYTVTGFLDGDTLRFKTITEWDKWQSDHLPKIVSAAGYDPICTDDDQRLFKVRPTIDKTLVAEGQMYIDLNVFHCGGLSFPLEDITKFAVAGQKVLLFGLKDGSTYEVRSETPRSALKYREIFKVLSGG